MCFMEKEGMIQLADLPEMINYLAMPEMTICTETRAMTRSMGEREIMYWKAVKGMIFSPAGAEF